jgi:SAM-dependent methyltransferase
VSKQKWEERYLRGDAAGPPPDPLVQQAGSLTIPGVALDLACGLGRHSLLLAGQGWRVTAVDSSQTALSHLRREAEQNRLSVHAIQADLESGEFQIGRDAYDLICDCCYLQRSLYPEIRAGLRAGGIFVAILLLADSSGALPDVNPDYLVQPGELQALFGDWEMLHYSEGRPEGHPARRPRAEMIARKPPPTLADEQVPRRSAG